ncbi:MAG: dockerin type I domain-containing protein, partial [Clostridium sp.]
GNTVLCTVHSGEKATLIGEDKVVYIPIELIFDDRELKDEDLNRDGEVDILDLTEVSKKYGLDRSNDYFNYIYDVIESGVIDIYDLVRIARSI